MPVNTPCLWDANPISKWSPFPYSSWGHCSCLKCVAHLAKRELTYQRVWRCGIRCPPRWGSRRRSCRTSWSCSPLRIALRWREPRRRPRQTCDHFGFEISFLSLLSEMDKDYGDTLKIGYMVSGGLWIFHQKLAMLAMAHISEQLGHDLTSWL